VKNETVAFAVGYGVGLLALLLWPDRKSADQDVVLIVGVMIVALVSLALGLTAGWRPRFDLLAFLTQTGPPRKPVPRRSWIPRLFGSFAIVALVTWLRSMGSPDWGLTAYTVSIPLLYLNDAVPNLIWGYGS
jgi:hypothetical protein